MNILVANDDGIHAKGIQELVKALSKEADVYVIGPHTQRSGASQSITMGETLVFKEVDLEGAKKAYSFTGTPTDCVKMGMALLEKQGIQIDCVYSGINHGGNLGSDTLYSGTVGAAREGLVNDKISVAVSVNSHDPQNGFDYACNLAVKTIKGIKEKYEEIYPCVININVPDLPAEEIKGLKIAQLGIRDYEDWFQPVFKDDGTVEVSYGGRPISFDEIEYCDELEIISDVIAMDLGYATVTPLRRNTTYKKVIDEKLWGIYDE